MTRRYTTIRHTIVQSAPATARSTTKNYPLELLAVTPDRQFALVDGYLPIDVAMRYATRGFDNI